jgi:hypothetical protein
MLLSDPQPWPSESASCVAARGHPLLMMRPANLPHLLRQGMLGARCLASRCLRLAAGLARDLSPALAPASGFRSCPAAPFRSPKPPMFAALRSRLAETAFLYRSGLAAVPDLRPFPSPAPARFTACPAASRRSCLKRADLHLAEASCMPSLDRRVDRHHRHPWDQNLRFFKALRLSVPVASCANKPERREFRINLLRPKKWSELYVAVNAQVKPSPGPESPLCLLTHSSGFGLVTSAPK